MWNIIADFTMCQQHTANCYPKFIAMSSPTRPLTKKHATDFRPGDIRRVWILKPGGGQRGWVFRTSWTAWCNRHCSKYWSQCLSPCSTPAVTDLPVDPANVTGAATLDNIITLGQVQSRPILRAVHRTVVLLRKSNRNDMPIESCRK